MIVELDADLDNVEPIDPHTIPLARRHWNHRIDRLYGHHSLSHAFN